VGAGWALDTVTSSTFPRGLERGLSTGRQPSIKSYEDQEKRSAPYG
jgi:hypothetical protein